ncbi:M24 family metallopeptidase [Seohaeicola nanhaiensis]|uniref:M24 family metallopeptidase n=1 Tax=Seohaeicola nanhaiensis TaxID=1387282 RepID=A0ABV9KD72_9RHOB
MAATDLPFTREEYAERLARVRKAMSDADLEALVVTDPSNQAWLTGYDGWSFYVHQAVVLLPYGEPIWWGRRMDTFGALRTVWMSENRVRGYDDSYVQAKDKHPMEDLAKVLVEFGAGAGRIGVEMDNYYFSARAMHMLHGSLPKVQWVDATGAVNRQRAVKSEAEIGFMRKAAAISEKMIDGLLERVEPGVPKNEIVAELYRDAIRGVDGAWGDYPAIVPMLPSGLDATAPHLTWDGRPFKSGEATFFEISGCYRRYHAPFCRTLFLGTPPDDMLRAEAALQEGLEAGIDAARAGNRACDIANALYGALKKAGITKEGRCGYSIGLSYPPDWGERTISLRENDETVLEPGMCFHFMPGLWQDNWGLEITEPILIRADGPAETFCNRPRKLFVKP